MVFFDKGRQTSKNEQDQGQGLTVNTVVPKRRQLFKVQWGRTFEYRQTPCNKNQWRKEESLKKIADFHYLLKHRQQEQLLSFSRN